MNYALVLVKQIPNLRFFLEEENFYITRLKMKMPISQLVLKQTLVCVNYSLVLVKQIPNLRFFLNEANFSLRESHSGFNEANS